jgi:hypothetical protein
MVRPDVEPDAPAHTPGTARGEDRVKQYGREPGRDGKRAHRMARDSTSISAEDREPIDPRMPELPPA